MEGGPGEKQKEENSEKTQDINKQKETMLSDGELEMDQEMTQSEMEMEDHELQDILDREHLDLEGFLKQGTMGGVDSQLKKISTNYSSYSYGKRRLKGWKGKETMKGRETKV